MLLQTVDDVFDGIPVRIYRPEFRMNDAPAIVFFHGGGWVFCSIGKTVLEIFQKKYSVTLANKGCSENTHFLQ